MAILKVRDANGNVQEVLAIRGESYVLTDADKKEIADLVSGGGNADLSNYYTKSEVNNLKVSAFTNDAGYLTEAQVLALIQANMPINGDGESY